MSDEKLHAKFLVKNVRFHNHETGFTVIDAEFLKYESDFIPTSRVVVTGCFLAAYKDDEFECDGVWQKHEIFGYQFFTSNPHLVYPETDKGMVLFLERHVKGLGHSTALKIVSAYRENTINKILDGFENLTCLGRVSEKKAKSIVEQIKYHVGFQDIAIFIIGNGFSFQTAVSIYEQLGLNAISDIKKNPYCMCFAKKIGFKEADKMAANIHTSHFSPHRIKCAILSYVLNDIEYNGNLFIYQSDIVLNLPLYMQKYGSFKQLDANHPVPPSEINKYVDELVLSGQLTCEEDSSGAAIYIPSYHAIENGIVSMLAEIIKRPSCSIAESEKIEKQISIYESLYKINFADMQKNAVEMALTNNLSILSGGPGTGKTQTINLIIYCIKSMMSDAIIRLCAPTGKASKRMTELTGLDASTIHRLISLNAFDTETDVQELTCDYLIVDESSMIDAYVFYKLLSALGENTHVLFVGDYEQLPSVGPGLILRDLISCGKIPVTILNEIFRQAKDSQIVTNSHKLICGKKTTDMDGLVFKKSKGDFYFIDEMNKIKVQKLILKSIRRFLKIGYCLSDIQVLCPIKKDEIGVYDLNRQIQQLFNPNTANQYYVSEIDVLRVGDRVMQTMNNYDLNVFNGSTGTITSIQQGEELEVSVDYDGETIVYDEESVEQITLAYATTIHKSQGSEFKIVIMPIHSAHVFFLNRNLIYTAWTRAKEKIVVIGEKSVLDNAVERTDNTIRNSKIKEKLIAAIK